jgi:hypothetical protein
MLLNLMQNVIQMHIGCAQRFFGRDGVLNVFKKILAPPIFLELVRSPGREG